MGVNPEVLDRHRFRPRKLSPNNNSAQVSLSPNILDELDVEQGEYLETEVFPDGVGPVDDECLVLRKPNDE